MKNNRLNPERVCAIFSSVFLLVAFLASLKLNLSIESFIPSQSVVTATHAAALILAVIVIFKQSLFLEVFIMLCESVLTLMTGYMHLGIFLFYGIIILMFIKGKFKTHTYFQIIPLVVIHIASIISCFVHSWIFVIMGLASSLFYAAFLYWVYDILKAKLSCFLPTSAKTNSIIREKPGEALHLSDYQLSDRQMNFIIDNLHENCTYKELSLKYFVSLSTVKKDFSELFRIFDVGNLEELHLLLLQYQISK